MQTQLKPLFMPPAPPSVQRFEKIAHVVPSKTLNDDDIDDIVDSTQVEFYLERLLEAYGLNKKPKINRRVWHEAS